MVASFLRRAPGLFRRLQAGLANADRVAVSDTAHALKGITGQIGAASMAALMGEIERAARTGDLADALGQGERVEPERERLPRALEAFLRGEDA
jgi:HPt (histidine-containing phosphotransfer) domain-containing protein